MQYYVPVSNLNQITTRNHPDLQELTGRNDHPHYSIPGVASGQTNISYGLDANKPGTASSNSVYVATDTKKWYYTFTANTWTEVLPVFADETAAQGDMLYKSAAGWSTITGGSSGQALLSTGSSTAPTWGNVGTSLIMFGSGSGNYTTTSTSLVDVDGTNLKKTMSNLTVGKYLNIKVWCDYFNNSSSGTPVLQLTDVTNSVSVKTIISGTGPSGGESIYTQFLYKIPSTSIQFSLQWNDGTNGTSTMVNTASTVNGVYSSIVGSNASSGSANGVVIWIQTI